MKKKGFLRKAIAYVLTMCLLVTGLFVTDYSVIQAAEGDAITTVYFYNSEGWATVGAHAWNDGGDLTGGWGTTTATASAIGEGWYEIAIPSAPSFNVIFFNKDNDAERSTVWFADTASVYGGMGDQKFTSKEEAEKAVNGSGDTGNNEGGNTEITESTTVYFYNSDSWATVGAHAWNDGGDLTGGWGTTTATASAIGEGWYEIAIPSAPSFNVIFFNKDNDAERSTVWFADTASVYGGMGDQKYTSKEEAEKAVNGSGDTGNNEGGNTEITESTTVYFYNSDSWATVGAHAWNGNGDLTGGWGTTTATASAIGEGWYEIAIPSAPSFNVIFFNKDNDKERSTLWFGDTAYVYGAMGDKNYTSKEEAEESVKTSVYFLNTENWSKVYATAKDSEGNVLLETIEATDKGDNWWQATVLVSAASNPFTITFSDGSEANQKTANINNSKLVYMTGANDTLYSSAAEAEIALGLKSETTIYFLNSKKWSEVGTYAYYTVGEQNVEPLGSWAEAPSAEAAELGGDWVKITVPDETPFSIIFYDESNENDRVELGIPNAQQVYVALDKNAYDSKEKAEEAWNNIQTVVYFLNTKGWTEVGATIGDKAYEATAAASVGENWWQVTIPQNALLNPFDIVFHNNKDGEEKEEINATNIKGYDKNYVTADAKVYSTYIEAEQSMNIYTKTTVYFLNSKDWASVGVYVYGTSGERLGSWPGKTPEAASEMGEKWMKIDVPGLPKFNIIFFNTENDGERTELEISSARYVYVTGSKAVYGSQLEAELAEGMGDLSKTTELYFYNSRGWGDINGYFFEKEGEEAFMIGASWPGKATERATEIGENWWKIRVPKEATANTPFYAIFNDGVNQTDDILIDEKVNVYITAAGGAYPTAEEAEAAAAKDTYDDGCEDGPNVDLENYKVTYNGAGAALPYVTYEAESAKTNAEVLEKNTVYRETIQSEASGRQAVKLNTTGEYVEFTLTKPANTMVLRYNMPDSADGTGMDASLSMYINGTEKKDLALTSKYAWVYGGYPYNNNPADGKPHRYFDEMRMFFDETLPAGTTIKLQKDAADTAANYIIDFIECELVGAPLTQPANSLSVTDFGAVANDGQDDYAAFVNCINAAQAQDKEVWIPAGTFDLTEEKALKVEGLTVRGAGMWYTNLVGAGVSFAYSATCKFYDFAMTGVATVRDDSGDLAGFEGKSRSTNVTIQNIWMEHIKVGVWSANTDRMMIQGCRIRNTYADGINLCSGTNNSVVRNNSLRNTGDDCIAIWPWLADCSGNKIEHNTIQVPTLANGVAIYGGGKNIVDGNYVADTINNGAGIVVGSEFDTAKGYVGTITVRNNVLNRCGSMQTDENYPIGAIWIWSSWSPMTTTYNVHHNQMKDCSRVGITIECNSELTGLNIQHNTINGATDAIFEYLNGTGSGKVGNMTVSNITGEYIKDDAPNFILTEVDEDIIDEDVTKDDTPGDDTTEDDTDNTGNKPVNKEELYKNAIKKIIAEGACNINISSAKEFLKQILSAEELAQLEAGADISVKIEIGKITIPDKGDKEAVQKVLGNKKIGYYFDIDLLKLIGETSSPVTELSTPVRLTLDIPEDLRAGKRTFSLIRIHNGVPTELKDLDADLNTITIETDSFSTYVLVYEDETAANNNSGNNQNAGQTPGNTTTSSSPKTGDNSSNVYFWIILTLLAGVVVMEGTRRYFIKKENE